METIRANGTCWLDTDGHPIHAHGGHILKIGACYYWYGEDRTGDHYISCYRSADLLNWEFRTHILTTHSRTEDIGLPGSAMLLQQGRKINLERPKLIYSPKLGRYVLWAHYENGSNYREAAIALATCETPDGNFVYHGFFRPFGEMSRDCTICVDRGTAYFLSASNENRDLHIYRMNEQRLGVEQQVASVFNGESREAPAVFRSGNQLFLISSQCTGWMPNQGGYACADTMEGSWSELQPLGDATTYRSQPACILPLYAAGEQQYIYIGDRWGGSGWDGKDPKTFDYFASSYYMTLLKPQKNGKLVLLPCEKFTIDPDRGFQIL